MELVGMVLVMQVGGADLLGRLLGELGRKRGSWAGGISGQWVEDFRSSMCEAR